MNIKKIYFQDGSEFETDSDKIGRVKLLLDYPMLSGYVVIKYFDEVSFHRVDQIKLIVTEVK
ncbi:hypothetical protein GH808_09060 [Acetobacterium fimetarium]|uniref:Uncharacterized protein n=1 Tax=Acetobacterium fimetarium TaxID=52691 RepID=A0ABR6WVM9_9FIRM|nr:hypothetical protein [Acetobacterium fimetarium]MBC3804578.1 hypothetical protein [Acetobacterium fimetarium]